MSSEAKNVLLAEDNPGDVFLIREALRVHGVFVNLHVTFDGEEAIRFLDATEESDDAPCPVLALIDLNLPKRDGLEVLKHLRQRTKCARIPVALLSSSRQPPEAELNQPPLFANRFFKKPNTFDQYMTLGAIVTDLLTPHETK
jgi:CheY-like chemotaxis protein